MNALFALLLLTQTHPVAHIDTIIGDGVRRGVFPGAVVVVGTGDTVLLSRGYGGLTWSQATAPSPDSILFDLASLTKVVATTPSIMLLIARGRVELDLPVTEYLPAFAGEGKEVVTVRHLLSHTSGLRAFLPLHTLTETAAAARARVLEESLRWAPGARVEYSDLNAMLLGWIVEAVSGRSLDEYVRTELYAPLDMRDTHFNLSSADRRRAAPINQWRGEPIQGVIHDQNAARLEGVSGHAGLYSTGRDLARLAQFHLRGGVNAAGERLVPAETVAAFLRRGRGNRALGWEARDTTTADNAGSLLSTQAVGHSGFTGTSLWIDPQRDLFVILLTNRVFAPRSRRSISELKAIRGRIADAAVRLKERSCRVLAAAGAPHSC